jgi:hypothetical protein
MGAPCPHWILMPHKVGRRQPVYFCISCREAFSISMNDQITREELRELYPTPLIMRVIWWCIGPFLRRQKTVVLEED